MLYVAGDVNIHCYLLVTLVVVVVFD